MSPLRGGTPADRLRRGGDLAIRERAVRRTAGSRSPLTPSRTPPRPLSPSGPAAQTSSDVPTKLDLRTIELIHDRLHGAWADLKDCVDGRHGHGAKAQRIERDAAEAIAAACSQLRVLLRYALSLQPVPGHVGDAEPRTDRASIARKARR